MAGLYAEAGDGDDPVPMTVDSPRGTALATRVCHLDMQVEGGVDEVRHTPLSRVSVPVVARVPIWRDEECVHNRICGHIWNVVPGPRFEIARERCHAISSAPSLGGLFAGRAPRCSAVYRGVKVARRASVFLRRRRVSLLSPLPSPLPPRNQNRSLWCDTCGVTQLPPR